MSAKGLKRQVSIIQRQKNLARLAVILAKDIKEKKPLVADGFKGKLVVQITQPLEQIARELGVGIGTLNAYLNGISTYTKVAYKVSRGK